MRNGSFAAIAFLGLYFIAIGACGFRPQAVKLAPGNYWLDGACTHVTLQERPPTGVTWCVDSVLVRETGEMEFHCRWSVRGFRGVEKAPDEGNRRIYLLDQQGRRYDHVATTDGAKLGGRIDGMKSIRGVFVFPAPATAEPEFTFRDDDQNLAIAGIRLDPRRREASAIAPPTGIPGDQSAPGGPPPTHPSELASLLRPVCFGTCPAYSLRIFDDGTVIYLGHLHVKEAGERRGTLAPQELSRLIAAFERAHYFSLRDRYDRMAHLHSVTVTTSFSRGGRSKTIVHDLSDQSAPEELTELEDQIDSIVGSVQWVGTEAERAAARQELMDAATREQQARIPGLVKALSHRDPSVRRQAAFELVRIGGKAEKRLAAMVLAAALQDPDVQVRVRASDALRFVGPDGELARYALTRALKDSSVPVRMNACWALKGMGTTAASAAGALGEALGDTDRGVRLSAAHALEGIGSEAKAALPALVAALRDPDPGVRDAVAGAFKGLGPAAAEGIPALAEVLRTDASPGVRRVAAFVLGKLGATAFPAIPALQAALKDPVDHVRSEAADALRALGAPQGD